MTKTVYQWARHWGQALSSGVRKVQLEELHRWRESREFDELERAALKFTEEITLGVRASDEAFNEVRRLFTPDVVVELTLVAAFYAMVVRVLQTLDIELEPGFPIVRTDMDLMYAG